MVPHNRFLSSIKLKFYWRVESSLKSGVCYLTAEWNLEYEETNETEERSTVYSEGIERIEGQGSFNAWCVAAELSLVQNV